MTQITGALSAVDAVIQLSTNGTSWTDDISGSGNKVTPGDSTRKYGSKVTFDGDVAIITFGKRDPVEITFDIVYTEGASDPYTTVRGYHVADNGTAFYVRWIPKGLTAGNYTYTVGPTKVSSFKEPDVDADSADPLMFSFTVPAAQITRSTYAT